MSKYAFIDAHAATWAVSELCRVLEVSRSGYYHWRAALLPPAPAWQAVAQQVFTRHASRYGTRRLRAELQAEGHRVGRYALYYGPAGAQYPPPPPAHHPGGPGRRGGREPAAGPARAHCP
ncbi:transposase [Hymenobacter lutimineralis]|uniref:transposase n=1 Tax=Hymenobacter lutimineralis TaxID=2606448 RepID=UPI001655D308|nr:transposase [Hymenobacter lutimineralis]